MLAKQITKQVTGRCYFSLAAVGEGNYKRFRTTYVNNLSKFKQTMDRLEDTEEAAKLKSRKAYSHPYHNQHSEINLSPARASEIFFEFVGPEQVSPHYESFLASRKWAIGFWTTLVGLSFVAGTVDLHWVAKSTIIPFTFWMTSFYWTFEGRKSIVKPMYHRWYRALSHHDINQFHAYYKDTMRVKVRQQVEVAREQMDYYLLHQDFKKVKAESINRFLAHEQMNVQKNVSDRAQSLLQAAKQSEVGNQRGLVNKVINAALADLESKLESEAQAINDAMFESALTGIKNRSMTYENDPVLPIVLKIVRAEVQKFNDLSEEEQLELVALTEAQIKILKDKDEAAKQEYLTNKPKLDQMTMGHETVSKMMENWGA